MRNIINLSQVLYSIFLQEQNGIVFQTYFQLAFCAYFAKSQILQNTSAPPCVRPNQNKTMPARGIFYFAIRHVLYNQLQRLYRKTLSMFCIRFRKLQIFDIFEPFVL